MENELISVIIPVYKVEDYLRRCVDSVLNQTYKNLELILVDDGSPDGCPAICDEYAAKDSRVHVIHKENGGVSSARNAGLDYVFSREGECPQGGYIAFIDSDDWVHPYYFERLIRAGKKHNAQIVICDYMMVTGNVPFEEESNDGAVVVNPLLENVDRWIRRTIWARIYSVNAVNTFRFNNNLKWGEDSEFGYRVFGWCNEQEKANRGKGCVVYLPNKLYFYFQREASVTHSLSDLEKNETVKWFVSQAKNTSIDEETRATFLKWTCKETLANRYLGSYGKHREEIKKDIGEVIQECRSIQKQRHLLPKKDWILFQFLFACPSLYRLFRIIDDPTLLKWEKMQKQKRKENSK